MKKVIIICLLAVFVYACKQEVTKSVATAAPSNFVYPTATTTIVMGTIGNSVAPTIIDGGGTITYSLTGLGITGISINMNTGIISWTSALAVGTYNISVLASNSIGSTSAIYKLIVNGNGVVVAPTNLLYSPASTTIVTGTAGSSAIPTITNGGGTITYSLTGTVPTGITISATTGVISWSNAVAAGVDALNVQAANSTGNTTTIYTLTVTNTATVTAPSGLTYSPSSGSAAQGVAGTSATPTINNGLGTITYSLTGTVPAGITINASTGVISWSTTVAIGTYTLTVTATNSAGNTTASYSLAVAAPISYSTSIAPTLKTSCSGGCHSWDPTTYAGVSSHLTGCNAIQFKINTTYCSGSRMPTGTPLSASYITLFTNWVNQGALNN